ncbi:MAG: Hsp20/alpha crystallin family protein [Clostridiaceae bacterium]|jgi:HSP20 family protein|nr:Hsp20/alpha crystallin family protein [Clostridiaceae bacterium]
MFGLTPYRKNSSLRKRDGFGEISDFIDNFFNDSIMSPFLSGVNFLRNEFSPMKADVRETEKEYVIDVEIPGAKKENINLDLRDDVLNVCVEQNEIVNEERENYIRKERRYGSYSRSFYVPDVKHEEITAKYKDGILTINLPKTDDVRKKSRKIDIQ